MVRKQFEKGTAMTNDEDLRKLAQTVRDLFLMRLREFRSEDFVEVAGLLGFHAYEKPDSGKTLKLAAENCLPDIIGTSLQYAVEA